MEVLDFPRPVHGLSVYANGGGGAQWEEVASPGLLRSQLSIPLLKQDHQSGSVGASLPERDSGRPRGKAAEVFNVSPRSVATTLHPVLARPMKREKALTQ